MTRLVIVLAMMTASAVLLLCQTMSFQEILRTIDKNNPSLKVYDSKAKALNKYAEGARALDPPKVSAGLFMAPYDASLWKSSDVGGPGMGSFMISAEQMFTNPSKLDANEDYMRSMASEMSQTRKAIRNELFRTAAMNYIEWQIMKRKRLIVQESENLLNYTLKSAEIKYRYGLDKLGSYYKAKGAVGEIQAMALMIDGQTLENRTALNTLMNRSKELPFDIDTLYSIRQLDSMAVDTNAFISHRSDYKALEESIKILRARKGLEQSKLLPDFGVRYDHMFAFGAQPQQLSLMFMVTLPFAPWSASNYDASVSAIDDEIIALESQQQSLVNDALGTIRRQQVVLKSRHQQLEMYDRTIIPSMRQNYETSVLSFEQNTEDLFVVLEALNNLKLAQLTRLDILQQMLGMQAEIETQLELWTLE